MTHICISKLTIIGSDNGLLPGRHQAIILINAGRLLTGPLRAKLQWNLNQNSHFFIQENPIENVVWKMAAILSQPQCVEKQFKRYRINSLFVISTVMEINIVATDGEVQVKDVVFPDKERITDDKWSKSTDSICISGNTIKQYGKDGKRGEQVYFDGLVLDFSNSSALVVSFAKPLICKTHLGTVSVQRFHHHPLAA